MATLLQPPILLAAMPALEDPNFHKSLILLAEYNHDGALGFILNRPLELRVKDIIVDSKIDIPEKVPAWIGGPVGTETGLVLHSDHLPNENLVCDGVALSSSDDALKALVDFANDHVPGASKILYPYRFLVGYAGWGPAQLDEEIKQGSWIEIPLSTKLLFNTPWQSMWTQALDSVGLDPTTITHETPKYVN
jgi:putative transcriptional regulator